MNVRLYSGTVRCADHFDASTYESETTDPCLYCGATDTAPAVEAQSDEEWLNALSTLAVTPPRRAVQLDKVQCSWCSSPAAWKIIDELSPRGEYACSEHGSEWYPDLFPQVNVA